MKKRVYIAGPITKGPIEQNIRQADEAFFALLRAGLPPLCPHWSCVAGGPYDAPKPQVRPAGTVHTDWYGTDLPWVAVADALLRLPGESVGADLEAACAREHGKPVFETI